MVPCGHSLTYYTWFVVIQAVLNSRKGEKLAPNWPSLLLWQLKSLRNGPNMAQNGPKRLQKAPPSTVWLYPCLMYFIWGPFTQFWDTKRAKIASELARFLYFNFKPSGGWGTHLVALFCIFLCIFGLHMVQGDYKKLPGTYHTGGGKAFFECTTVCFICFCYLTTN